MTPRLDPAPYTNEDSDIWVYVGLWPGFASNYFLELNSAKGDRRDADLMLALREARKLCDQHRLLHCVLAWHHTALIAYDDPDVSLVELGLAMRIPKLSGRYR
jgi:hypothetical protein